MGNHLADVNLPTKRHLDPSDRLATTGMCWKLGGSCAPLGVAPYLTQCGQDRGLLPYQVPSWSIKKFGHNGHGLKTGGGGAAPFWGQGAVSAFNIMWPRPTPTSVPSGIFVFVICAHHLWLFLCLTNDTSRHYRCILECAQWWTVEFLQLQ